MNPLKWQVSPEPQPAEASESIPIQLSALMDGEWANDDENASVWQRIRADDAAREQWHVHHLIGEVLRGELTGVPNRSSGWVSASACEFAAEVVRRAQSAEGAAPEADPVVIPPLPVDASKRPVVEVNSGGLDRAERVAANDREFRWKAVAGVASLCATLAVVWNAGLGVGMSSEPLAAARTPSPADAPVVAVAEPTAAKELASPVWVQTGQGVMQRDARLDALIQAHRQHGGATAWQIPTGFMRAASHESVDRP